MAPRSGWCGERSLNKRTSRSRGRHTELAPPYYDGSTDSLREQGAPPSIQTDPLPGIWKRLGADGKPVYEITYRDSDGRQRRQTVIGGVRAAEAALAKVKSDKGQGKRVAPNPRLTFEAAAERWMQAQASRLRPSTREAYRSCLDTHLLPAWGKRRLR